MIRILSLILFLLLIIVGKTRGLKAFVCFYLNYFLILLYIILMGMRFNSVLLSVIICLISSSVTLFILNGINKKTISSFISVSIILIITLILVTFVVNFANIQGFSYESLENIGAYSLDINYNMKDVLIGIYLVTTIGTIIDTSISVSSALNEVYENNLNIREEELFVSGMNVGKDILSTTINTLFFAFIGGFIGFFFWHKGAGIEYIINYKVFAEEVMELLLCFISSILIIPVTSYITTKLLKKD